MTIQMILFVMITWPCYTIGTLIQNERQRIMSFSFINISNDVRD